MNAERFLIALFAIILISTFGLAFVLIGVSAVDSVTLKEIGEESVPCIDKNNRPFENEMCTDTIYCSWLGFVGDEKCVNVLEDER